MSEAGTMYEATTTGRALVDGKEIIFRRGVTRVRAPHPLLDQCPGYFRPIRADYGPPEVEQMTADPGEKRGEPRARARAR